MANVWDNSGRLIGSTRTDRDGSTKVYGSSGQPVGSVNKTGTWGNTSRVSGTKDAGLLWRK